MKKLMIFVALALSLIAAPAIADPLSVADTRYLPLGIELDTWDGIAQIEIIRGDENGYATREECQDQTTQWLRRNAWGNSLDKYPHSINADCIKLDPDGPCFKVSLGEDCVRVAPVESSVPMIYLVTTDLKLERKTMIRSGSIRLRTECHMRTILWEKDGKQKKAIMALDEYTDIESIYTYPSRPEDYQITEHTLTDDGEYSSKSLTEGVEIFGSVECRMLLKAWKSPVLDPVFRDITCENLNPNYIQKLNHLPVLYTVDVFNEYQRNVLIEKDDGFSFHECWTRLKKWKQENTYVESDETFPHCDPLNDVKLHETMVWGGVLPETQGGVSYGECEFSAHRYRRKHGAEKFYFCRQVN